MLSRLQRVEAFVQAGIQLHTLLDDKEAWEELCLDVVNENTWFTSESLKTAVLGMISLLEPNNLLRWSEHYTEPKSSKTIGVIMAGNLPFVGFHDALCVLISGHQLLVKLSSSDTILPKLFFSILRKVNPELAAQVHITEYVNAADAVIATGSNNSSRYFEKYFSKLPHVIRKNRNSVAIITGLETERDLTLLGDDLFMYFGLGCRSISKVLIPKGYDITKLFPNWERWQAVVFHNRYANNYEYQKSLLLINKVPHLDTGFLLIKQESAMASNISVLHYEYYEDESNLLAILERNAEGIQCVALAEPHTIPNKFRPVPFGNTQLPSLFDYADGVDVMQFLLDIK